MNEQLLKTSGTDALSYGKKLRKPDLMALVALLHFSFMWYVSVTRFLQVSSMTVL